jgi:uncharacterized protein (UPF0332 family)
MLPVDLIFAAHDLAHTSAGKPKQAHLRRAISTAYYAMFHTLARTSAALLIGGTNSNRSKRAWVQTYRALEHGVAKNCCLNQKVMPHFPKPIQDFANMFVQMQLKRHDADYDPHFKAFKSAVVTDIYAVAAVLRAFDRCSKKGRRAFAAFILLKQRGP